MKHCHNIEKTSINDKVAWKTSDGNITTSHREALRRQKCIDFSEYFSQHTLNRVPIDVLIDWLDTHRYSVLCLLEDINCDT